MFVVGISWRYMVAHSGSFSFTISKNKMVLIGKLSGSIEYSSAAEFDRLTREILSDSAICFVLLDFSKVKNITMDLMSAFIEMQKKLRSEKKMFSLCGLNEDLKDKLFKLGVIRKSELSIDLKDAILQVSSLPLDLTSPSHQFKKAI